MSIAAGIGTGVIREIEETNNSLRAIKRCALDGKQIGIRIPERLEAHRDETQDRMPDVAANESTSRIPAHLSIRNFREFPQVHRVPIFGG